MTKKQESKAVMLFVGGSDRSFRCACGCNVFEKVGEHRYACNACGITYTGDPAK